ncbi:unnamed protein product [Nyctereutes procyonoides]|uniref:(raccoon dog) hypothetical protein n=1 Tax=Nyctereutes procyonoides TaxID=34880 RepID=A0A811Y340_NYCPR|nr:unnamed protein product [Nyctereutes procyonoides]
MQMQKLCQIAYFPHIVSVPAVLTEQYPEVLGPIGPKLGAQGLQPVAKTCFSMVPAVQRELDTWPQLCLHPEYHTLDLLDQGLQVHVVQRADWLILQLMGDAAHPQFKKRSRTAPLLKHPILDSAQVMILGLWDGALY